MAAVVVIDNKLDPFDNGRAIPSGAAAMGFEHRIADALTRCKSAAEWLSAAATKHTADHESPAAVLERQCRSRFIDRPAVIPANAAACVH
jgi:hypothetical protein